MIPIVHTGATAAWPAHLVGDVPRTTPKKRKRKEEVYMFGWDDTVDEAVVNHKYVTTRPKHEEAAAAASVDDLHVLADTVGGDIVCAESKDGRRYAWVEVAFRAPGGDRAVRVIGTDGTMGDIRMASGDQRCRPLALRLK